MSFRSAHTRRPILATVTSPTPNPAGRQGGGAFDALVSKLITHVANRDTGPRWNVIFRAAGLRGPP